jgi:hypothetical protein
MLLIVLVPLIAWRFYKRVRRLVGRQKLGRVRPWFTLLLFSFVLLMIALAMLAHPGRLGILAAGAAAGGALGRYGLRKTTFEPAAEGFFYTPNAHLGIAISLLFVGRLLYRFVEIYALGVSPQGSQDFVRSPLTLAVFGLLAGYYVAYEAGLVAWRWRVARARKAATPGVTG